MIKDFTLELHVLPELSVSVTYDSECVILNIKDEDSQVNEGDGIVSHTLGVALNVLEVDVLINMLELVKKGLLLELAQE